MDVRTNSDYFPIQHYLTGFYNRERKSLLRGTDWILKNTLGVLQMNDVRATKAKLSLGTTAGQCLDWQRSCLYFTYFTAPSVENTAKSKTKRRYVNA
jgi:hypothetical protein